MYEGHFGALVASKLILPVDLQLFPEDDDLGPELEIDVDALGDDAPKLKSMLGKALHENKRIRKQAGRYRTELRTVEQERETVRGELTALQTEHDKSKADLETANRANGQYKANFKQQLVDGELRTALKEAGAIDGTIDLILPAIKRDAIKCDDETFKIDGVKETIEAFKGEKPSLFGKVTVTQTRGTSTTGAGPGNGGAAAGGGDTAKLGYRDPSKTLEQLEREIDQQRGWPTVRT